MKPISIGKREAIIEPPKHNKGKSHSSIITYFIFVSGDNVIIFIKGFLCFFCFFFKSMGKKLEVTEQVSRVL